MVTCCECGCEDASRWHWQMHDFVEQQRCVFRFASGFRNIACAAWHMHTLKEQEHMKTMENLRQRKWGAECGFCSVSACKYGRLPAGGETSGLRFGIRRRRGCMGGLWSGKVGVVVSEFSCKSFLFMRINKLTTKQRSKCDIIASVVSEQSWWAG